MKFIIGEDGYGCSWYTINGYKDISKNNASYKISGLIFGSSLIVVKGTKQYESLEYMVNSNSSWDSIKKYLNDIVFEKASLGDVEYYIKYVEKNAFDRGVRYNQSKIKKVLNIE